MSDFNKATEELRRQAKAAGTDKMTEAEIQAEIDAARAERRADAASHSAVSKILRWLGR